MTGKPNDRANLAQLGPLKEGEDYVIDEFGRLVFTAVYLLKRGYCCENGCRNCPYGFERSEN